MPQLTPTSPYPAVSGHWLCPFWWVTQDVNATQLSILNYNLEDVSVVINFFDPNGLIVPQISRVIEMPARTSRSYHPPDHGLDMTGWLSISAPRPIYPSGYILNLKQMDARRPPPIPRSQRVLMRLSDWWLSR